jgi:hypothetical protein
VAGLKEELAVNDELASPLDFLPELPGWRDRSRFRFREGNLEVFDFDLYSQALSKLERGFELDLADVQSMVQSGKIEPGKTARALRGGRVRAVQIPGSRPSQAQELSRITGYLKQTGSRPPAAA